MQIPVSSVVQNVEVVVVVVSKARSRSPAYREGRMHLTSRAPRDLFFYAEMPGTGMHDSVLANVGPNASSAHPYILAIGTRRYVYHDPSREATPACSAGSRHSQVRGGERGERSREVVLADSDDIGRAVTC